MFSSKKINENMLFKIAGGHKTSWKRINKGGDTVASGSDTFSCDTGVTTFDDGRTNDTEDLCLG